MAAAFDLLALRKGTYRTGDASSVHGLDFTALNPKVSGRGREEDRTDCLGNHGSRAVSGRSLDVDVIDPSLAPATGTPVPGGFTYYQICDVLDAIAAKGRVVGFDITEVSPPYDVNNETSLMAAYLGLRFLGSVFTHHRPVQRG